MITGGNSGGADPPYRLLPTGDDLCCFLLPYRIRDEDLC